MLRRKHKKVNYTDQDNNVKWKSRNLTSHIKPRRSLRINTNVRKNLELHPVNRKQNDSPYFRSAYFMLSKKEPYIITASDSIVGNRAEQQDSCYVTESTALSPFRLKRTLGIVCDGMGGLEAGDRASLTAVSMMKLAVNKLPTKKVDIPHFLSEMLDYIDCEINHWDDLKTDKGSGTTMVSVLIENRRLYWASVGDSSIFMFQDDTLKKITNPHNYKSVLDKLVEDGRLTEQQAVQDPQKNALLSYLGMGGVAYRDINSKPYVMKNGDLLLLCTDGVTDTLTEEEIADIIRENIDDIYQCCKEINVAVMAKKKDIQDNSTVVMVHYVE